jgi:hypothetical protein
MIDASQDPWFDLDLVNYQAPLVNGYTRMTAQAGLEIFMPDLDEQTPKKAGQSITLEWLKDRNRSLPLDGTGICVAQQTGTCVTAKCGGPLTGFMGISKSLHFCER